MSDFYNILPFHSHILNLNLNNAMHKDVSEFRSGNVTCLIFLYRTHPDPLPQAKYKWITGGKKKEELLWITQQSLQYGSL